MNENTILEIANNEMEYGKCSPERAATLLNEEDSLQNPPEFYMSNIESNPDGSLKYNSIISKLKSGELNGLAQTLATSRLYSLAKPHEKELEQKEREYKQLAFEDSGFLNRFLGSLKPSYLSLERSSLIAEREKALIENKQDIVDEKNYEIKKIDEELDKLRRPTDDVAGTTSNIAASLARLSPGILASSAIGVGLIIATGGVAGPAVAGAIGSVAGAATIGVYSYNDTQKISQGEILEQLSVEAPYLSEEDRYEVSLEASRLVAGIDALSAAFGPAGLAIRGTKTFVKGAINKKIKEELVDLAKNKIVRERIKDPKFWSYVSRRVGEHIVAQGVEAGQEVSQELIQDAYIQAIKDGADPKNIDVLENIDKILEDDNNINKYANLAKNVFLGGMLLSGAGASIRSAATYGMNKLLTKSYGNAQIEKKTDRILDLKKKSKFNNLSKKAYSMNTEILKEQGSAPDSVSMNAADLETIRRESEQNGEVSVLNKLNELGLTKEVLDDSIKTTGQVKIDFTQFDDVVLDPNDTKLYQKVKGKFVFDETTLSSKELIDIVGDITKKIPELESSINEGESIFNITLSGLKKNKNFTPRQAVYNAALAQLMANRAETFEGVDSKKIALDVINQKAIQKKESIDVNSAEKILDESGIDYSEMGADEKINRAYDLYKKGIEEESKELSDSERVFVDDLSNLNELYSKTEEKYTKETININGVERPTKNSLGKPIAETESDLKEFYKWFGNSKVIDKEGRPLVVYHGTGDVIKKFVKDILGSSSKAKSANEAFFFAKDKIVSEGYAEYALPERLIKLRSLWEEAFDKGDIEKYNKIYKEWEELENEYSKDPGGRVYSAYLKLENPLLKDYKGSHYRDESYSHLIKKAKEEGRDGVVFLNTHDAVSDITDVETNVYSVFEPENILTISYDVTSPKNTLLMQGDGKIIAGSYQRLGLENIIRLTESANPTTFVHEFNHLMITEMLDSFNSGRMTEYWKKQTLKIADFVGAKVVNEKLTFTTEQFEKLADAFTTYIKEGRAPVEGLRDIFNRMAEWFIATYKRLVLNDVPLNKSIRSAFDALLVSKEEFDKAAIDKNINAIGRRPGVSEHEYQSYLSDLAEVSRTTTNKHLDSIRKKARTALEKRNRDKLNEIREEISARLDSDRRYALRGAVIAFKVDKTSIPEGVKIPGFMIAKEGEGLPLQQYLVDYSDVVSSPYDFADILTSLPSREKVTEAESAPLFDAWMNEQYPELMDVDAKLAAANKKLVGIRVKEFMMLNKIPLSKFNQYYNELVIAGDKEVANMKIKDLVNIEKMQDLELKIVTKQRFAKSDTELANLLWHQAALNYILMRAKDIKVQVDKFTKHFDKYKYAPKESDVKNKIDAYDFDLITAVLGNFGFASKNKTRIRNIPVTQRIIDWSEGKLNNNFSEAKQIYDYSVVLGKDRNVSFDNNNYKDFGVLDVTLRLIEGISKNDKTLVVDKTRKTISSVSSEIYDNVSSNKINTKSLFTKYWIDNLVMKETFLKSVLPSDVFERYVLPFINSHSLREQRIAKADRILVDALKDVIKKRKTTVSVALDNGETFNMTYEDLQVAILNIVNKKTWIDSFNKKNRTELTENDYVSILSSAPDEMFEAAQKIWDLYDSQKEEFRHAQYKINGWLLDYVEPETIVLNDGREIKGGYFPSVKAPKSEKDLSELMLTHSTEGIYPVGTSKNAKDRLGFGHSDLDLTIDSIRPLLYHTATIIDIAPHYKVLKDVLNTPETILALGENEVNSLNQWMQYSIVGDHVNKFYSVLDQISSIQILGWEPYRMVIQMLGFIPAMAKVDPVYITKHFLSANNWTNLVSVRRASELSPYMKQRYEKAAEHIGMVSENRLVETGHKTNYLIMNAAMAFTVRGDAFASSIVWNAEYEKSIAKGKTRDEAILLADSAVRTTQGDTTSVSRTKILQGDKRFFTKFASYFLAANSLISSAIVGRRRLEAVATIMLVGVVSPIIESVIDSFKDWSDPSDDDRKKWKKEKIRTFEDLVFYNAKKNVVSTLGTTILPVAGGGGYFANYLSTGNVYSGTPPLLNYYYNLFVLPGAVSKYVTSETSREKEKYGKQALKSSLKALTVPNKYIKMIID